MAERNNYKQNPIQRGMQKRGQVTIYVIIAILIVVIGTVLFFFRSDIGVLLGNELVPNTFLLSCVQSNLESGVTMLAEQGGYADPEGYIMYQGKKIKYLCYNAQYYLPCQVQQPLIKEHFEKELNDLVRVKAEQCARELRDEYKSRGYTVTGFSNVNSDVKLVPGRIRLNINAPMTVSKQATQTFEKFNVDIRSEMYDLLMISTSIIDYESTFGDSETSIFTRYYPDLRIYKIKLGDGSTIYTVQDVNTEEEFTFASRSLAWPGGLGNEA